MSRCSYPSFAKGPLTNLGSLEYHCAMVTLCLSVSNVQVVDETSEEGQSAANQFVSDMSNAVEAASQADWHTLRIATILRDYRETYGLKVATAYLFQAEAVCCMHLLGRLDMVSYQARPVYLKEGSSRSDDIRAAFEESFRCLLGTGTQMLMARAVSRMVTQTANELGIGLPSTVNAALQALHIWQSLDVKQISSSYPNYAIAKGLQHKAEAEMEFLLHKWEQLEV